MLKTKDELKDFDINKKTEITFVIHVHCTGGLSQLDDRWNCRYEKLGFFKVQIGAYVTLQLVSDFKNTCPKISRLYLPFPLVDANLKDI